jgi:hypothetical protein
MKNKWKNNLLMFYFFFKFIKKNEDQILQVKILEDEIKKN